MIEVKRRQRQVDVPARIGDQLGIVQGWVSSKGWTGIVGRHEFERWKGASSEWNDQRHESRIEDIDKGNKQNRRKQAVSS
ncbi:hypothetical protein SI65_05868 [Aspergillus cristatus]|uniref:Uncharacterized protein n=1 Tax=Aspergillus cristatus TaxID=573508 RepID=A0A1E3BEN7_ASPCR|nr:hypothetical protein SI65_05868 [Aspergillus cristatus]